ncbi:hypothetical protein QDR37_16135 [Amnibacterium sp. CER49]|uniref:TOPRIM nucleotidyl transferase/hydrolase domain-containing protein n=1 Tax=Amnibacterium sp. CER49 TaxID=3039161 RepID=UPI00244A531F|nr:TOPRIM nucleotidyl transferase/hydrolase domain-containing protein [Amnibacterium sp. CER49]MDH2445477.1 hypothetical protein [Amnibacterium sp. CER49]
MSLLRVDARGVVLVEGRSDRAALLTAAHVAGRDLAAARVAVVPMGGITNLVRTATEVVTAAPDARVVVLADAGEAAWVRAAVPRLPVVPSLHWCERDLEEELLRALGADRALAVLAALGDLHAFRTFQGQPAQRDRGMAAQLHRFLGTASGRKERAAAALTAALRPDELPPPLVQALDAAVG